MNEINETINLRKKIKNLNRTKLRLKNILNDKIKVLEEKNKILENKNKVLEEKCNDLKWADDWENIESN